MIQDNDYFHYDKQKIKELTENYSKVIADFNTNYHIRENWFLDFSNKLKHAKDKIETVSRI